MFLSFKFYIEKVAEITSSKIFCCVHNFSAVDPDSFLQVGSHFLVLKVTFVTARIRDNAVLGVELLT